MTTQSYVRVPQPNGTVKLELRPTLGALRLALRDHYDKWSHLSCPYCHTEFFDCTSHHIPWGHHAKHVPGIDCTAHQFKLACRDWNMWLENGPQASGGYKHTPPYRPPILDLPVWVLSALRSIRIKEPDMKPRTFSLRRSHLRESFPHDRPLLGNVRHPDVWLRKLASADPSFASHPVFTVIIRNKLPWLTATTKVGRIQQTYSISLHTLVYRSTDYRLRTGDRIRIHMDILRTRRPYAT